MCEILWQAVKPSAVFPLSQVCFMTAELRGQGRLALSHQPLLAALLCLGFDPLAAPATSLDHGSSGAEPRQINWTHDLQYLALGCLTVPHWCRNVSRDTPSPRLHYHPATKIHS